MRCPKHHVMWRVIIMVSIGERPRSGDLPLDLVGLRCAEEAEVRALEGEPLTVECSLRVEQRTEWRVDGAAPAPDMRAAGELPLGAGRLLARLHSAAARLQHAGLYSCHRDAAAVRVLVLPQPAHAGTSPTPLNLEDINQFKSRERANYSCLCSSV